ncbi:MAG: SDR family NAD(P)-dependent oxidoreductase [Planctomycetaceae bacterium]|nr:SDR family NAD(P)-dependent oxidoreductase [Planctomycetaceae bacterium]
MDPASRTFIVTGGASGLGAGTARQLVARGANVVVADVNAPAGEALAGQLGSTARFAMTDVTSPESGQAAVDLAIREFGSLDGLVSCAGILGAARIIGREGPHDLALFRKVVEVNLVGTFNMLRLAATAMSVNAPNSEGERGVIVNTASIAVFEGQVGQAAYAASKGGVASLTLPAARELSRLGIRVVAIAPGLFDTAMMSAAPDAVRQSLAAQSVFPTRFGRADEFAQLVVQIVENSMFNGTVVRLDGAVRMQAK